MAKSTHETHWPGALRRMATSLALLASLLGLSSATFAWTYRDDLLTYAAELRMEKAVGFLVGLGARAYSGGSVYAEAALIEYLHSLLGEPLAPPQSGEITRALLRAGAAVDAKSELGWTPLMLAAAGNQLEITRALVESGGAVEIAGAGDPQIEGLTPLMVAAMHGNTRIVKYLLEKGARINRRTPNGSSALVLAASRGHLDCVDLLLEKGAVVSTAAIRQSQKDFPEIAARLQTKARVSGDVTRRPARTPEP